MVLNTMISLTKKRPQIILSLSVLFYLGLDLLENVLD